MSIRILDRFVEDISTSKAKPESEREQAREPASKQASERASEREREREREGERERISVVCITGLHAYITALHFSSKEDFSRKENV